MAISNSVSATTLTAPDAASPRLLTVKQAAEALALAPRTIRDHIRAGAIDAVDVGAGAKLPALRIPADSLAKFIESRRTKGRP